MKEFIVSAPGKVILYGEHAVVYGKTAIAASISLRTYLLASHLSSCTRMIHLQFPDIGLDQKWLIEDLPWNLSPISQNRSSITLPGPTQVEELKQHTAVFFHSIADDLRRAQHAAASAFLSEIPVGAGLGSSASMAVCISTALLLQTHRISIHDFPSKVPGGTKQLTQVNQCAFIAETFVHGNPSGVDNTISSRGGAIRFKRSHPTESPSVEILENFPQIPIILTNTRQSRNTSEKVAKVRDFKAKYPLIVNGILEAIGAITESASLLLKRVEIDGFDGDIQEQLGELFALNHYLLASLRVSHPKLERIRHLVDYGGVGWTKLTGAGGGGCAITIPRIETPRRGLKILEAQIEAEGFEQYQVSVGGPGVGIIDLANQSCDDTCSGYGKNGLLPVNMFKDAPQKGLGRTIGDYAWSRGVKWRFGITEVL